jgi:hypothetical protein
MENGGCKPILIPKRLNTSIFLDIFIVQYYHVLPVGNSG